MLVRQPKGLEKVLKDKFKLLYIFTNNLALLTKVVWVIKRNNPAPVDIPILLSPLSEGIYLSLNLNKKGTILTNLLM